MRSRIALTGLILALGAGVAGVQPVAGADSGPTALIGTFRITAGSCAGGKVSGSTFRMVVPNGGVGGPFVSNNDSACSDHSYTLLAPGVDGGLVTGTRQPEPNPAFDGSGNSLANRVTQPTGFYGIRFSTSTNAVDPQTGVSVAAPSLSTQNGSLIGDLRAFAASWNRQEFNQGAPKPDGSTPGITARPSGRYDAATRAFSVNWASQIQGGPFSNFTGLWHLEGTFVPAGSSQTSGSPNSPPTGGPSGAPSTGSGAQPTGIGSASLPPSVGPGSLPPGAPDASNPASPTSLASGQTPAQSATAPQAQTQENAALAASPKRSHRSGAFALLVGVAVAALGAAGAVTFVAWRRRLA